MSSLCTLYKLFEIRRLIFHIGNPRYKQHCSIEKVKAKVLLIFRTAVGLFFILPWAYPYCRLSRFVIVPYTQYTSVMTLDHGYLAWQKIKCCYVNFEFYCFAGFCFIEESIPESGSTVAGGEGESVSFYCRVLREINGTQVTTEWFIERIGAGGSGPQTIVANSNFEITGEPIPSLPAGLNSQTNLTIRSLTSDLDRANLSCGRGGTPPTIDASFILRIYRKSGSLLGTIE